MSDESAGDKKDKKRKKAHGYDLVKGQPKGGSDKVNPKVKGNVFPKNASDSFEGRVNAVKASRRRQGLSLDR